MDYLKYLDMDSMLHKLDPRTKFMYFIVMAVVTSIIKSGVALLFLFAFFLATWIYCGITKYIGMLAMKLRVLLCFIFFAVACHRTVRGTGSREAVYFLPKKLSVVRQPGGGVL